jgi:hypothetical protein
LLQTGIRLAALIGLAAAGAVAAQPVVAPPAPPEESAPKSGASEEAPPINVPTPAPIAAPPISEKEVAPAAPPAQAEPKAPGVPVRRNRYDVAVIEAIDKVTAESLRFEAAVNRPIRYKSLIFTVKACERSTPEEAIDDSIAYLTIDSQPRPLPGKPELSPRQAFRGWMYASSPGLHPLEHPVYDAWLITCRAAAPPIAPAR